MFLGDEVHRLEPPPPETWQLALVAALLFTLFASVVIELQVGLMVFYALALAGVVNFFRTSTSLSFTEQEQTGFLILVVFFLISLLTYWLNGMPGRGDMFVESRHAKFLLVIPVYILFRRFSVSQTTLWLLAVAVLFCLLLVVLIDLNTVAYFASPGYATGGASSLVFAVLTLTMSSLVIAFRDTWGEKRWPRHLARFGISAGMVALFYSHSYSIWPAFVLIVLMYLFSRVERLRIRHVLLTMLVLLCTGIVLYQLPVFNEAWDTATKDYSAYRQSESVMDPSHSTDIGIMLESWRAAVAMIKDNPLLGVGPGGYQATASLYVDAGDWAPSIATFKGPGNLYLSAFATRGFFGLITTLLLMIAPLLYCYRLRRRVDDQEVRQYAFAVMLVVGVFLVAGLSIDILETKSLLLVYCTVLALLIGQIRQRIEN